MKKLLALGVIVATLFISGCLNDAGKSSEQATVQPASNQVVLYFANQDLTKLVSERRDLTNTPRSPQAAVDLLLNGPKSNVAQILFPKDVKCLGVKTVNGVATVDFNDAIKTVKNQLGSSGQLLLVASLADTLTEFTDINAIRIAVNGKPLQVLGELDLSDPVGRSEELIEK